MGFHKITKKKQCDQGKKYYLNLNALKNYFNLCLFITHYILLIKKLRHGKTYVEKLIKTHQ